MVYYPPPIYIYIYRKRRRMTTVYDVPAKELIDALTKKLQDEKAITPPEWSHFAKTGIHTEKPPTQKNWWHVRCASLLRKIYIMKGIGVERLSSEYGGIRDRGSKPNKACSGSRSVVREALQQLETAGYVTKVKGKGRMLTAKGSSFVDNTSHEVMQILLQQHPELKKY